MPVTESTLSVPAVPHLGTTDVHFRRILLALDFSAQTHEVVKAAVQIALSFHSELYLVHASTPLMYGTGGEPNSSETFEVNLEIAQSRMAQLLRDETQLASLPHKEIVAYARALDLIQQVIEDEKIDLVIAVSHGAHGMERLALGSVAECILRTVPCPVLVVGPRATSAASLFSSVLLAADLTTSGLRASQYATALTEHALGKLTILHIVEPSRHGALHPELLDEHIREQLQELVPADFAEHAELSLRVEYGSPGSVIASAASDIRSTLVVTGARDESLLADHSPRATLGEVIRRSPCPVFCVRGHVVS